MNFLFFRTTVRLGELVNDEASPLYVPVQNTITHPKYSRNPVTNDIALIQLRESVSFTGEFCKLSHNSSVCSALYPKYVVDDKHSEVVNRNYNLIIFDRNRVITIYTFYVSFRIDPTHLFTN